MVSSRYHGIAMRPINKREDPVATVVRCDRKDCRNEDILKPGKEPNGSMTVRRVGIESKGWQGRSLEADLCESCRKELASVFFGGGSLEPRKMPPPPEAIPTEEVVVP